MDSGAPCSEHVIPILQFVADLLCIIGHQKYGAGDIRPEPRYIEVPENEKSHGRLPLILGPQAGGRKRQVSKMPNPLATQSYDTRGSGRGLKVLLIGAAVPLGLDSQTAEVSASGIISGIKNHSYDYFDRTGYDPEQQSTSYCRGIFMFFCLSRPRLPSCAKTFRPQNGQPWFSTHRKPVAVVCPCG